MKRFFLSLTLLLCAGCGPKNREEFQQHVAGFCSSFADELKEIETREQLIAKETRLRARFEELVDLLGVAESLRRKGGMKPLEELPESATLRAQFERVAAIEGGREVIERAQREPMIRLAHLYERERGKSGEPLPLFVQR